MTCLFPSYLSFFCFSLIRFFLRTGNRRLKDEVGGYVAKGIQFNNYKILIIDEISGLKSVVFELKKTEEILICVCYGYLSKSIMSERNYFLNRRPRIFYIQSSRRKKKGRVISFILYKVQCFIVDPIFILFSLYVKRKGENETHNR